MTIFESFLLGLVQGLAEFLPVSSSGHLVIMGKILGTNGEPGSMLFNVLLHFATLFAVVIYYRKRIWALIVAAFHWVFDLFRKEKKADQENARFVFFIILATLPLFLFVPVRGLIEDMFSNVLLVGVALLITGAVLFLSDRVENGTKSIREASVWDILLIGIAQVIALVPGISRSGSTMSAGIFSGLERKTAVEFAFVMSLPAVLGATVLELIDALKVGIIENAWVYIIGMAVAFVSGLIAIRVINILASKKKFKYFAYYCAAIGIFAIFYSFV